MTQIQLPECIVCFQSYDHEVHVPRVLSCGHSFCEPCLHELHTTWQASTSRGGVEDAKAGALLRCPECNLRTRVPIGGQKGLPKNVALLRLLPSSSDSRPVEDVVRKPKAKSSRIVERKRAEHKEVSVDSPQKAKSRDKRAELDVNSSRSSVPRVMHNYIFSSDLRSDASTSEIRPWILPQGMIELKGNSPANADGRLLYGEIVQEQGWTGLSISVSLLPIWAERSEGLKTVESDMERGKEKDLSDAECSTSREKSYEQRLLDVLEIVAHDTKLEISLLFRVSSVCHRVCKTFGLWMNQKQELYLVSEFPDSEVDPSWQYLKQCTTRLMSKSFSPGGSATEDTSGEDAMKSNRRAELQILAKIVVGLCELLLEVHSRGLTLGLLSPQCIVLDQFDNLLLNTNGALSARYFLREITGRYRECMPDFILKPFGNARDVTDLGAESTRCQNVGQCWEYMSPEVLALLTSNLLRPQKYDSDGEPWCGYISEEEFLSPEQGEARVSPKADVWSLGCLIFELITGKSPLEGLDFSLTWQHIVDEKCTPKFTEDLECLDPDHQMLKEILQRCFEHDPKKRADVHEVLQRFKELQLLHFPFKRKLQEKRSDIVAKAENMNWVLCLPGFSLDGWFEYERKLQSQRREAQSTQEVLELNSEVPGGEFSEEAEALEEEGERAPEVSKTCFMEPRESLKGHRDYVTAIIICGDYLLSASFDKTICVWSLASQELLKTLKGHHTQVVTALAVDQVSGRCFSGDNTGNMCAWRLDEESERPLIATWQEHGDWRYTGVASLATSGDGFLYSGSGDRTIKVWSSLSFDLLGKMEGHKALVSALVVDGELLYSGSWDGGIRVWWRSDYSPMAVLSTSDPTMGGVRALCMSSGLLFSGHDDGSIQVWKDEEYQTVVKAHKAVVSTLCVGGPLLYSGSWDQLIKVWLVEEFLSNPLPVLEEESGAAVSALVSDGNHLYAALAEKAVKVYAIDGDTPASSGLA